MINHSHCLFSDISANTIDLLTLLPVGSNSLKSRKQVYGFKSMSEESPISEITSGFYHQTYHLWNNQRIISYHQTVSNSVECPALQFVDPSIGIVTCECSEPIPTSQLGSSSGIDMYKTWCLNPGWTCSKKKHLRNQENPGIMWTCLYGKFKPLWNCVANIDVLLPISGTKNHYTIRHLPVFLWLDRIPHFIPLLIITF